MGGLVAALAHHRGRTIDLSAGSSDRRSVWLITLPGVVTALVGALVAVSIPRLWLGLYIGTIITVIGAILIIRLRFRFTWTRLLAIGLVSAMNKVLSGGGFGPLVTGGQMVTGRDGKLAVGTTTAAEVPICLVGFVTYTLATGLPRDDLVWPLLIGAVLAAPLAPRITMTLDEGRGRRLLGLLVTILGALTILKVAVPLG